MQPKYDGVMMQLSFTQRVPFLAFIRQLPDKTLEAMLKELTHEISTRRSRK